MCHKPTNTDRYGDGDVPEVDIQPYQDNNFDPHPQASGENRADKERTR